ncbi:MAG TPA: hypothetical protein VM432_02700 [Bdellovibrionales bacterium]|nr:hypothetical protein [Bdellovibrionales bacterium]
MAGVLALIAAQLILMVNRAQTHANETMAFDEDLARLQYQLERPFRFAVNAKSVPLGANINASTLVGTNEGRIRTTFDSGAYGIDGRVRLLAIFYRENQGAMTSPTNSSLKPTAVYFQQPTPNTYGMLYVDNGNGVALSPDLGDVTYGKLTRLIFSNPQESSTGHVTSFEVEAWLRYPTNAKNDSQTQVIWCPPQMMGVNSACPTGSTTRPYKDIQRKFTILLPNNSDSNDFSELLFGRVYFLR